MAQENFDRISRLIRKEVEAFDFKKAEDFKKTIIKYLETMLSAQEQISEQWERYLPEIKVVNVWNATAMRIAEPSTIMMLFKSIVLLIFIAE